MTLGRVAGRLGDVELLALCIVRVVIGMDGGHDGQGGQSEGGSEARETHDGG